MPRTKSKIFVWGGRSNLSFEIASLLLVARNDTCALPHQLTDCLRALISLDGKINYVIIKHLRLGEYHEKRYYKDNYFKAQAKAWIQAQDGY